MKGKVKKKFKDPVTKREDDVPPNKNSVGLTISQCHINKSKYTPILFRVQRQTLNKSTKTVISSQGSKKKNFSAVTLSDKPQHKTSIISQY